MSQAGREVYILIQETGRLQLPIHTIDLFNIVRPVLIYEFEIWVIRI